MKIFPRGKYQDSLFALHNIANKNKDKKRSCLSTDQPTQHNVIKPFSCFLSQCEHKDSDCESCTLLQRYNNLPNVMTIFYLPVSALGFKPLILELWVKYSYTLLLLLLLNGKKKLFFAVLSLWKWAWGFGDLNPWSEDFGSHVLCYNASTTSIHYYILSPGASTGIRTLDLDYELCTLLQCYNHCPNVITFYTILSLPVPT